MRKDAMMITAIGPAGTPRPLDGPRADTLGRASAAKVASTDTEASAAVASPIAALVGEGAPIDFDKVARIKAGLADGTYKADPQAIAGAMMALDLPTKA